MVEFENVGTDICEIDISKIIKFKYLESELEEEIEGMRQFAIQGQRSIDVEKCIILKLACNMTPLIRALTLGAKI